MATPLRDKDPMPFGQHAGRPMQKVPASYLDWLDGQSWLSTKYPEVKAYIDHNRAVIDKELEDPKNFGNEQ